MSWLARSPRPVAPTDGSQQAREGHRCEPNAPPSESCRWSQPRCRRRVSRAWHRIRPAACSICSLLTSDEIAQVFDQESSSPDGDHEDSCWRYVGPSGEITLHVYAWNGGMFLSDPFEAWQQHFRVIGQDRPTGGRRTPGDPRPVGPGGFEQDSRSRRGHGRRRLVKHPGLGIPGRPGCPGRVCDPGDVGVGSALSGGPVPTLAAAGQSVAPGSEP